MDLGPGPLLRKTRPWLKLCFIVFSLTPACLRLSARQPPPEPAELQPPVNREQQRRLGLAVLFRQALVGYERLASKATPNAPRLVQLAQRLAPLTNDQLASVLSDREFLQAVEATQAAHGSLAIPRQRPGGSPSSYTFLRLSHGASLAVVAIGAFASAEAAVEKSWQKGPTLETQAKEVLADLQAKADQTPQELAAVIHESLSFRERLTSTRKTYRGQPLTLLELMTLMDLRTKMMHSPGEISQSLLATSIEDCHNPVLRDALTRAVQKSRQGEMILELKTDALFAGGLNASEQDLAREAETALGQEQALLIRYEEAFRRAQTDELLAVTLLSTTLGAHAVATSKLALASRSDGRGNIGFAALIVLASDFARVAAAMRPTPWAPLS